MFQSPKDYLQKKSLELDLRRGQTLKTIQECLDRLYPQSARALSLNDNVLKVVTKSASVASELRIVQIELLNELNKVSDHKITKLQIKIGSLK